MVKTYRKRPLEVEAIQFTGAPESIKEIKNWIKKEWPEMRVDYPYVEGYNSTEAYNHIKISIPWVSNNEWDVPTGGWLVKGVDGSLYPVKDETFRKIYEEVSDCKKDDDGGVTW